MSIPNRLTAVRFLLIPVFVAFFMADRRELAFVVWMLAGVTDILDGYLARKWNQVTEVGMMLDPLADKLMMMTVIVSLFLAGDLPLSCAIVMFVRDAGLILGALWFHVRGKKTIPASWMGKATTVLYYAAVVSLYFGWAYAVPFLWLVIGFSCLTLVQYTYQIIKVNQRHAFDPHDHT
ncbi:MAG: CDP-alcohol phosphatidyltransferase family protein [Paenibacillus sp.]|uniref:CDP-diacylglycerol--glycerol-3-phosphate 3-phosphatidyltransferase n=1 Tax=Paenibacillus aquistagni TaxID=1852522 RepID=A0A1X7KWA4_9BACL|nr:CDP-alcohol phosphatidyltransferase family protein [Paenibacillus aquistagni]MBR2569894.1 CDP-alcohol phosphatidyltransferase family protein [Paenibacillus sp.]NMM54336.1 CDP-diacylglycerol--glycerol-3-phosphate 3-phosphatidyltransferase [Paenibacillus aquistagni]SMG45816.1 cardiolipin synthase [Paenibacillus aquistagni]